MEYDDVNRLVLVTFEDTSTKFIAYNAASKKTREDDENGHTTRYEYDELNRLIKTKRVMPGADDLVTEMTYNEVGSKLTQTDPNGNVTEFEYDSIQRLVLTRDALENETVLVYGANSGSTAFDTSGFKPTQATDARGFRVINTYDDLYRVTESKAEYATNTFAITTMEYDAVGNPVRVTDPLESVTETEYDALNRPVKVTLPDLTEQLTVYAPAEKLVISHTDELGRETTFEYDLAGRQVLVRQPDPGTGAPETTQEYDEANNVVAMINPLGNQWDYTFDVRNRRTEELQPEVPDGEASGAPMTRPLIVTAYDFVGNVVSVTDPRGNTTTTEYDAANRKIQVTQPAVPVYGSGSPVAPVTTTAYDLNGNVLTVTDAEDNVTENTYDELNRLTSTRTWPESGVHSIEVGFEYDDVGNRTAQIDGNGCRVEFEYDGLQRLTLTRHDAGTAKEAEVLGEYDAMLKTARVDATSRRIEFSYDVRHRLTDAVYVGQTVDNRHMEYDDVGNLLSVTYPNDSGSVRETASTYDALNRVITETSAGVTHTYEYDKAGNRTDVEYGGTGRTIESEYDALNRLQQMNEEASGGGGTRTTSYLRDLSGNLVSKTLPNGTVETRTHDALNRPQEIETVIPGTPDTVLLHQEYEYDRVGNVRHIDESYPGGTLPDRNIVNTYDGTFRLLAEEITTTGAGVVTTTYEYDDGNNRTSKDVDSGPDAGTTTYVIGDGANGAGANQIKQATLPDTTVVAYAYDLNGNRLTRNDGTQADTCAYDYDQRLVQLVRTGGTGAGTYVYAYDPRTRRVTRDESDASGLMAKVVFSGGTSVQEYNVTTTPALMVEYLRGHDWGGGVGGILYSIRSGVESYTHASARGDVISRTDDTGDITWEAQYVAFGKHPDEAGINADRQRANSKDEDPTGLLNEGFRYRDLETGTFITRDPAGFVDGPNLYTYVHQNPWTAWDPRGLTKFDTEAEKIRAKLDKTTRGQKTLEQLRKAEREFLPRLEKEIAKTKGKIGSATDKDVKGRQERYLAQLEATQSAWIAAGKEYTVTVGDPSTVSPNVRGGVADPTNFKIVVDPKTFYYATSSVVKKGSKMGMKPGSFYVQATLEETLHHELIHAIDRVGTEGVLTLGEFNAWNNAASSAKAPNRTEKNAVDITNELQAEMHRPPRTDYTHGGQERLFGVAGQQNQFVPLEKAQYMQRRESVDRHPLLGGTIWEYDPH